MFSYKWSMGYKKYLGVPHNFDKQMYVFICMSGFLTLMTSFLNA